MTRLVTPAVDLAELAHTVIFNRPTRPTPARSPAQRHERKVPLPGRRLYSYSCRFDCQHGAGAEVCGIILCVYLPNCWMPVRSP